MLANPEKNPEGRKKYGFQALWCLLIFIGILSSVAIINAILEASGVNTQLNWLGNN